MIDVVITSTCRMELQRCLKSFKDRVSCSEGFNFLVNIDVRKKHRLPQILMVLKQHGIDNIWINESPAIGGHVGAINLLYGKVRSRYYFSLEDDWVFLKNVDLDCYIAIMDKNQSIDHIRFSKERVKNYSWLYYNSVEDIPEQRKMNVNVEFDGTPLVKAHTLSFNPSINRTDTIQRFLPVPPGINPEKYLCLMYYRYNNSAGAYIAGRIGASATVRDIGRNRFREALRKTKSALKDIFTGNWFAK